MLFVAYSMVRLHIESLFFFGARDRLPHTCTIARDKPQTNQYSTFANAKTKHFLNIRQLILVALETKRHGHGIDGESFVMVNPAEDHRIGKGDRGFVLAESQVQDSSRRDG